jgi:hypothetical protein
MWCPEARYRSQNTVGRRTRTAPPVAPQRLRWRVRTRLCTHSHAAPAPAGRRLDEHRQLLGGDGVRLQLGQHRTPAAAISFLPRSWIPSPAPPRPAARSRPARRPVRPRRNPGSRTGTRNRVDGVGAGGARGGDQLFGVEVSVAAGQPDPDVGLGDVWGPGVGLGVDRGRADAEAAAGREDPAGDLPAIGHEHPGDHRRAPPLPALCTIRPLTDTDRAHITVMLTSGSRRVRRPLDRPAREGEGTFPTRCGVPRIR